MPKKSAPKKKTAQPKVEVVAKPAKHEWCTCHNSLYLTLPLSMAVLMIGLTLLFIVFAEHRITLLAPISWAFVCIAALGMLLAYKNAKQR